MSKRYPPRVPKNRELTDREWFLLQLVFYYSRLSPGLQTIGDGKPQINFKDTGYFGDELDTLLDLKYGETKHYSQTYSPRLSKSLQNLYLKGYLYRNKSGNFYRYYFTFTELRFYEILLFSKLGIK